jgi:DNA-binding response OmpR family regulator
MNDGKKRILIVEDDEEMRALLRDVIEDDGYKTDSVNNGSEAFRKLVKESFDLIITDLRMPGLTGLDILPGMKKLHPEAFIIVITAFGSEEVQRKALERGANAYLEKPIHFKKLRTLIHDMFSKPRKDCLMSFLRMNWYRVWRPV